MDSPLIQAIRARRSWWLGSFDALAWTISLAVFAILRMDLAATSVSWSGVAAVSLVAIALQIGLGLVVRLHHGRAALGSFEEMLLLGGVMITVGLVLSAGNALLPEPSVPRSVPVAATCSAIAIAAWGRACYRRLREVQLGRRRGGSGTDALVLGAGEGGRQILDSMRHDPRSTWRPIGLIDDDPLKRHRRVRGVPVLGTRASLGDVVSRTRCRTLIVAIPSADAELLRDVSTQARALDLDVKVVPGVGELFSGHVGISDLRDINIADLLGRHQIDTDVASSAGYLTGKRVLVTGAGGSIGSELCRQIHRYAPAELIMLDRDESALHSVQLSLHGRAMLDTDEVILADIRDPSAMCGLFERRRPQVIFHAAALKHLTMLEQYPTEAVKTNVGGTLTILESARAVGVERFVNISTDKAANPCSVLGYTKRIAEGLTAAVASEADGTYLSVRFGNVLGSRGSVLTAFAAQIAAGGPVTVTDPDVTRYFMTIKEACQLVVQAAAIGRDGEALVLDMGEPVRILDVAEQLIALDGRDVRVEFTGLRDGEKLHEDLFGAGEPDRRPVHSLVSHVTVPPISPMSVSEARGLIQANDLVQRLASLCANMRHRAGSLVDR